MNYLMFVDTETTNSIDDPFIYDLGLTIVDTENNIILTKSFVNADVFFDHSLMESAYFIDKMPQYNREIKEGKRKLHRYSTIKRIVWQLMKDYEIKTVIAHNAYFDYRSTVKTQRYLTCSRQRYFFPYGTEFWDTLKMARQTFGVDEEYINFCQENNFLTSQGKPRFTAEILYKFITKDLDFIEEHTGLEDTLIEKEIYFEALRRNPNVNGKIFD